MFEDICSLLCESELSSRRVRGQNLRLSGRDMQCVTYRSHHEIMLELPSVLFISERAGEDA